MSDLDDTLDAVARGDIVVIPTDTVYGIAASPVIPTALEAIFALKGRSRTKALPVLGYSLDALDSVASFDERARRVAEMYWPGPLTLVLGRAAGFDADLGGDDDGTVAVRVPALDITLALLALSGPLAVTSANLSGEPDALSVETARAVFGDRVAAYLGGAVTSGTPSTVVSLVGDPEVLREGALPGRDVLDNALAS